MPIPLLYYGQKHPDLEAELTFSDCNSTDKYRFTLSHAAGDTLIFTEEALYWKQNEKSKPFEISLAPGSKESGLNDYSKKQEGVQKLSQNNSEPA